MATNRTVPINDLLADILSGAIDTLVVGFSDHWGRLIGKRTDAHHFVSTVLEEGTENCD